VLTSPGEITSKIQQYYILMYVMYEPRPSVSGSIEGRKRKRDRRESDKPQIDV